MRRGWGRWLWLHHLRFWSVIDLYGYRFSGNITEAALARLCIAEIDRRLDHLSIERRN